MIGRVAQVGAHLVVFLDHLPNGGHVGLRQIQLVILQIRADQIVGFIDGLHDVLGSGQLAKTLHAPVVVVTLQVDALVIKAVHLVRAGTYRVVEIVKGTHNAHIVASLIHDRTPHGDRQDGHHLHGVERHGGVYAIGFLVQHDSVLIHHFHRFQNVPVTGELQVVLVAQVIAELHIFRRQRRSVIEVRLLVDNDFNAVVL